MSILSLFRARIPVLQSNTNMLAFCATSGANFTVVQQRERVCKQRSTNLVHFQRKKRCRHHFTCAASTDSGVSQKATFNCDVAHPLLGTDELEKHPIKLMACDIDGTILNRAIQITNQNIVAVRRLLSETDVLFVPATGKSRAGAIRSMGALGNHLKDLYPKGCPGVFLQGLIVFGLNGEVVYENKCDPSLANSVISVSKELQLDLIAYSRDSILCERSTEYTDLLPSYHEPVPEEVGTWENVIGSRPLNKFIYMAEPKEIDRVRPFVAKRIGNFGVLTQAQSNMLEVLPPDSCKGNGVRVLLDRIGITPENVLAIGDAENDLEMLSMVRYSCAVGNALPSVKKVAKYSDLRSNNDSGVAHAIERFILNKASRRQ